MGAEDGRRPASSNDKAMWEKVTVGEERQRWQEGGAATTTDGGDAIRRVLFVIQANASRSETAGLIKALATALLRPSKSSSLGSAEVAKDVLEGLAKVAAEFYDKSALKIAVWAASCDLVDRHAARLAGKGLKHSEILAKLCKCIWHTVAQLDAQILEGEKEALDEAGFKRTLRLVGFFVSKLAQFGAALGSTADASMAILSLTLGAVESSTSGGSLRRREAAEALRPGLDVAVTKLAGGLLRELTAPRVQSNGRTWLGRLGSKMTVERLLEAAAEILVRYLHAEGRHFEAAAQAAFSHVADRRLLEAVCASSNHAARLDLRGLIDTLLRLTQPPLTPESDLARAVLVALVASCDAALQATLLEVLAPIRPSVVESVIMAITTP